MVFPAPLARGVLHDAGKELVVHGLGLVLAGEGVAVLLELGVQCFPVGFGQCSPSIGDERAGRRFVSFGAWQKDGGMSSPCGTLEKAEKYVRSYADKYGLSEEHMQLSLF